MVLSNCGSGCGLIAALVGVFGFGSFGAPLKCESVNKVNADPFVLQTYKSTMCFLTSFLVLLLGENYTFSPFGFLSGFLWVSGGACGIFGIRNCGLALSVGTWSAITVLMSFAWGIFIFGETVNSIWETTFGVSLMLIGFIGMAYFSSPSVMEQTSLQQQNQDEISLSNNEQSLEEGSCIDTNTLKQPLLEDNFEESPRRLENLSITDQSEDMPLSANGNEEMKSSHRNEGIDSEHAKLNNSHDKVNLFGTQWDRRKLGLLGAILDGILGGAMLVPMHYSKYRGEEYVISFGTGAMTVTIIFWIIRWMYNSYDQKSIGKGFNVLPSMHIKNTFLPGISAGLIWSLGNLGQIMSVSSLGESIGMSIVQSGMIVSGILGITWFKEIKGRKAISFWSMSAFSTFIGIVLLSRQHKTS